MGCAADLTEAETGMQHLPGVRWLKPLPDNTPAYLDATGVHTGITAILKNRRLSATAEHYAISYGFEGPTTLPNAACCGSVPKNICHCPGTYPWRYPDS